MKFERLFPDQYRAFYNGPVSVCVERFGGVNSVSQLDIREFGGKLYPDRFPTPWFRRSGASMGHPLYGPAIRLLHEDRSGTVRQYVPEEAELFPFGCRSKNHTFLVAQSGFGARLDGHGDGLFRMVLSKHHMPEGDFSSLKNQLAVVASGIQWLPRELRGEGFDPTRPFPENGVSIRRLPPRFDSARNEFVMELECRFADHSKSMFAVLSSDHVLSASEGDADWILAAPVSAGKAVVFAVGFGESREEASSRASSLVGGFDAAFAAEVESCRADIGLEVAGMPEAGEFMRVFPGYQRHLLLAETGREAAIRAAADKFGFFALWDHVYPARDFLLTGEPERTAKALRYMFDYPHVETCVWITIHLIVTCDEYLAFTGDTGLLGEAMPHFRRYFEFAERFVDPATGLVRTSLNCGVDAPGQVGLGGLFYASCINGWWYDACRALENMASESGDSDLARRCAATADKIEASYERAFFVPEKGYLRAALNEDGAPPKIEIYQNTHTIGLDYAHGRRLFCRIMPGLAAYQAEKLFHPMGRTAVSFDSDVPCEMWKFVHMNQHLGHECKLARLGGRVDEAFRVMGGYLDYFGCHKCAIETFNLAGCDGDAAQTAQWQAFSATAASRALCHGLAGVDWHRGGLCWIPADDDHEVSLRNLRFRGRSYDFSVSGVGPHVARFSVNGRELAGTMQIPADVELPERVEWKIERCRREPEHPVLLCAIGAPVAGLKCDGRTLEFSVAADVRAPVQIYSPRRPRVTVNGAEAAGEWLETERHFWLDREFRSGDLVRCE